MTNRKTTRRALVLSLLSLLICCSMLVGTTFAWFTDSVTSGKNQIVAGNLDIELEYSKDMVNWASVQGKTDLFTATLWEPGHTDVVYLRLSNLGTLTLKYEFSMNFTDTVIGKTEQNKDIKLSEHLKYDIVAVDSKYATRDAAREDVEGSAQALASYAVSGIMEPETVGETMALVVYMPETVGNEANYRGEAIPQIDLGLKLFATQKDAETDSFGPDYDADVYPNPELVSNSAELLAAITDSADGEVTTIILQSGTYTEDLEITREALDRMGNDLVITAADGAKPVFTGNITLGYRNQGVGAAMWEGDVTFKGITFDQAATGVHSITVEDVKSLSLIDCTIIGDGDYGIDSARGNATGASKIVGCKFVDAGMQLLGNFATGLVIEDCTFDESHVNIQAGNGVTIQNCVFNATLTDAHVGDSFYMIRTNSTPVTVKSCEINIDSTVTGVAAGQAKWYLMANRGATDWTVEDVEVTLTDAAKAQTALQITACTSTGKINSTNLVVK